MKSRNIIVFSATTVLIILLFYWFDGYDKVKAQDKNITFAGYVKTDIQKMQKAFLEIPKIIKEAISSKDQLTIGSINTLAEGLEIYLIDYGQYPQDINEVIGFYVKSNVAREEDFYYKPRFNGSGYKLGITLDSGELYEINN